MSLNPWFEEKLAEKGGSILNLIIEVPESRLGFTRNALKPLGKITSVSNIAGTSFISIKADSSMINALEKLGTVHYDMPTGITITTKDHNPLKMFDKMLGEVYITKVEIPTSPFRFALDAVKLNTDKITIIPSGRTVDAIKNTPDSQLLTGKGVKMGVIDTGFVPSMTHPMIGFRRPELYSTVPEPPNDMQSHGCAHPDTFVYTSRYGFEKIIDFYESLDIPEVDSGDGCTKDLTKLDIHTISLKNNGTNTKSKIIAAHKIPIVNDTVTINNEIKLTPWHLCYVFNKYTMKIEEKRADCIETDDFLLSPSSPIEIQHKRELYNTLTEPKYIDEDLSYLIGAIMGDGHVRINRKISTRRQKYSDIAITGDNIDILNRCKTIANKLMIKTGRGVIDKTDENGSYILYLYGNEPLSMLNDKKLLKNSSSDTKIPELITASPLPVIGAFIAGIIDTDGSVGRKGRNQKIIRISSTSERFLSDMTKLLSLFGINSYISEVKSNPHLCNGKIIESAHQSYNLSFNFANELFTEYVLNHITHPDKLDMIYNLLETSEKENSHFDIFPISPCDLKSYIKDMYNVTFNSNHRCVQYPSVYLNYSKNNMQRKNLINIFDDMAKFGDPLYNIALNNKLIKVHNVSTDKYNGFFYDFTIDEYENYVAGVSDMVFIHNSWCTFMAGGSEWKHPKYGTLKGVAPEADLVHVKALTSIGFGSTHSVLKAMEISQKTGCKVVSMSLGGPSQGGVDDDPETRAMKMLSEEGMIFVVAAGNEGTDWSIGSPATSPYAITVGSQGFEDGKLSSFSSRGPQTEWYRDNPEAYERDLSIYGDNFIKPDVVSYGGQINRETGEEEVIFTGGVGWFAPFYHKLPDMCSAMHGTSQATPCVAGMVSCLLENNTIQSANDFKSMLATVPKNPYNGYGLATFSRLLTS